MGLRRAASTGAPIGVLLGSPGHRGRDDEGDGADERDQEPIGDHDGAMLAPGTR